MNKATRYAQQLKNSVSLSDHFTLPRDVLKERLDAIDKAYEEIGPMRFFIESFDDEEESDVPPKTIIIFDDGSEWRDF